MTSRGSRFRFNVFHISLLLNLLRYFTGNLRRKQLAPTRGRNRNSSAFSLLNCNMGSRSQKNIVKRGHVLLTWVTQERQCTHQGTLRRVRVTVVAVGKKYVLSASISFFPQQRMHCVILSCVVCPSLPYIFNLIIQMARLFLKNIIEFKMFQSFSDQQTHNLLTIKMLNFTVKTSVYLLLHVSVHMDHLQGAYVGPW
jgi:hypothetical protein